MILVQQKSAEVVDLKSEYFVGVFFLLWSFVKESVNILFFISIVEVTIFSAGIYLSCNMSFLEIYVLHLALMIAIHHSRKIGKSDTASSL